VGYRTRLLKGYYTMSHLQEFLACQASFEYFIGNYVKIKHPTKGQIPFELRSFQKKLIDLYENEKYVLATKFRQGGFTTVSVLYGLWKGLFHDDISFFVSSGTLGQAEHVARVATMAIEHFPPWLAGLITKNKLGIGSSGYEFKFTSSRLTFGTLERCRGQYVTHLMLDEAAFICSLEKKLASCHRERLYAISTVNGASGWFYDVWSASKDGANSFVSYHPDYKEHPDYTPEFEQELRKSLGEKGFQQEVLGNFIIDAKCEFEDLTLLSDRELVALATPLPYRDRLDKDSKSVVHEVVRRLSTR
jgi:hypothetical protein